MLSKSGMADDEDELRGLAETAKDAALAPLRAAVSKPARRAYLTTILFVLGAGILLGFAIVAYTLFYWSYIPPIGFERSLHFQFDQVKRASNSGENLADINPHPHATVALSPYLVSKQRYDVKVELLLPRSRDNREAGNFMLEATMYAPTSVVDSVKDGIAPGLADDDSKLAVSRRPAILRYRSPLVEYLWKLTELHWYLLNFRHESEKLSISMFEGLEFSKGWRNVPATMKLEVQSTHRLQIYSAKAIFRARFQGLRWMMYNHRIISAIVFISGFWATELIFAGLAWAFISLYLAPSPVQSPPTEAGRDNAVKEEDDGDEKALLSDTERVFPSGSKQMPLRYESPTVKQEEEDDDAVVLPEVTLRSTDADDEDNAETFQDSGLGTSLESSGSRRDSMRRRRSRMGSGSGIK